MPGASGRGEAESELRIRIRDLEIELEERSHRQQSLEEELRTREELTSDINAEIREARAQLVDAAREFESLNERFLALRADLDRARKRETNARARAEQAQRVIEERELMITDLEQSLHDTQCEIADLRNYIDGRKSRWDGFEEEIRSKESVIRKLESDLRQSNSNSQTDLIRKLRQARERIAEQTGEISAQALELERLQKDRGRLEAYANELRIRLQDQSEAARQAMSIRRTLETSVEFSTGVIKGLNRDIERLREENRALIDAEEHARAEFERGIRQVRFELTEARETIADQENVNEQLTYDLVNNRQFREALESHVQRIERDNAAGLKSLKIENRRLRESVEDFQQRLRLKDATIATLMEELAGQSIELSLGSDVEGSLQKIDGRREPVKEAGGVSDRERVARQLIGIVEGKELRFPLFKERLTIGRTSQNDIQIGMRFVSRRHAVIATDAGKTRIIDWGSRNGVYVNKRRITERILQSGDVITIGNANLRFEERIKR